MTAAPKRSTMSSPLAETLTTDESDEVHEASAVTSFTVRSEKLAVAFNWAVSPTAVSTVFPVMVRPVSCRLGAVGDTVAEVGVPTRSDPQAAASRRKTTTTAKRRIVRSSHASGCVR